jgi:hypothetical protein
MKTDDITVVLQDICSRLDKVIDMVNTAHREIPQVGDLLMGGKVFSSGGIQEWWPFPRYRVVAFHYKEPIMFVEVLSSTQFVVGVQQMPVESTQWKPFPKQ